MQLLALLALSVAYMHSYEDFSDNSSYHNDQYDLSI